MTRRPHQNLDLIRRVLGDDYIELIIKKLTVEEEFDPSKSQVCVETVDIHGHAQSDRGEGCGMVDAIWTAMCGRYAREYQSLNTVELTAFTVTAKLNTKDHSKRGSDAVCEVTLEVRNSENAVFSFADTSRSITASSARAALAAIEYFVNAERAFIALHKSIRDARDRQRPDLVTRYTQEIAEVVKSTSYAEVIETLKNQL